MPCLPSWLSCCREHEVPLELNARGGAQCLELVREALAYPGVLSGFLIRKEISERAALAPGEQIVGAGYIVDEGMGRDSNVLEAGFFQQTFELGGVDAIVNAGSVCRVGLLQANFDHGLSHQNGRLVLLIRIRAVHTEPSA